MSENKLNQNNFDEKRRNSVYKTITSNKISLISPIKNQYKKYDSNNLNSNSIIKDRRKSLTLNSNILKQAFLYNPKESIIIYNSSTSSIYSYSSIEYQNKSFCDYMEDKVYLCDKFSGSKNLGLFILCDGHGGDEASSFVVDNLPKIIESEIRSIGCLKDLSVIKSAFTNSFLKIDKLINNYIWKLTSGSTCSIIFIMKFNQKVIIISANIGDSSIIYVNTNSKEVKELSIDHKISNSNELNRINSIGGKIENERLSGKLAITRSFGDDDCKKDGLSIDPYVNSIELNNETLLDSYIILASDGIWDVMMFSDILKYANEVRDLDDSSKILSERIVKEAIIKGTSDNISVVCLKL